MQKELRLKRRKDFNKVFRQGKSVANLHFVLYVFKNKEVDSFRIGISASRKVGNSVQRNKIRRQIKEIAREAENLILPGHDLVLIVRKSATEIDFKTLQKSFYHILKRASIYKRMK